jgi:hypothetical protein
MASAARGGRERIFAEAGFAEGLSASWMAPVELRVLMKRRAPGWIPLVRRRRRVEASRSATLSTRKRAPGAA